MISDLNIQQQLEFIIKNFPIYPERVILDLSQKDMIGKGLSFHLFEMIGKNLKKNNPNVALNTFFLLKKKCQKNWVYISKFS